MLSSCCGPGVCDRTLSWVHEASTVRDWCMCCACQLPSGWCIKSFRDALTWYNHRLFAG